MIDVIVQDVFGGDVVYFQLGGVDVFLYVQGDLFVYCMGIGVCCGQVVVDVCWVVWVEGEEIQQVFGGQFVVVFQVGVEGVGDQQWYGQFVQVVIVVVLW